MNCGTVILITKNNIQVTRVSPASIWVKKSGLEPSTFAAPGLYFPFCRVHPLTGRLDIIMQHAYAGTVLNVKGVKSKINSSMTWLNGQYGIMPLYASKLRCLEASPHY